MNVQIVKRPTVIPGKCIHGLTGESIDTGVELPGYGRVYISAHAVRQACRKLGMVSPETTAKAKARIEALEAQVAELQLENGVMRPAFEAHLSLARQLVWPDTEAVGEIAYLPVGAGDDGPAAA